MSLILGIETSCDETAAAVVDTQTRKIKANAIFSQIETHRIYGGVVPEIASRAHLERMRGIVEEALAEAQITLDDVDAIAATRGPGLLGGLLVGFTFAKSLALAVDKPLIGVNHLEGHALTASLTNDVAFPYLLLLVSGGHCQLIHVKALGDYSVIGGTLDDAVGECFDKVAKMLGLPYPGGPEIEKCALEGDATAFAFPIPMRNNKLDFSFSGLKTAVRTVIRAEEEKGPLDQATINNICAAFQKTVGDTLVLKVKNALEETNAERFVLAGGVAANKLLRSKLEALCADRNVAFFAPPLGLCTDNAVMIAFAGGLRFDAGQLTSLDMAATPRWPVAECTPPQRIEK